MSISSMGCGERLWPRPGRIFAAARSHTFAALATANLRTLCQDCNLGKSAKVETPSDTAPVPYRDDA